MFDKYFTEYEVGERRSFPGYTITESHVVAFAGLVGDHYPLHMDAEYARASRFGQRIVHGFLVLAASSGMFPLAPGKVVAFYGMDGIRFLAPTFFGDTLRCEHEVIDLRQKDDRAGVVSVRQMICNQRNEDVCVATLHILVACGPDQR
jgi:3-hydroxybutyryl-CoA dehydratase